MRKPDDVPNHVQVEGQYFRDLSAIVAERTSPVVLWVGSGVSTEAGLPSWGKLRELLEAELRAKAEALDKSGRESADKTLQSIAGANPWKAFQELEQALGPNLFGDVVRGAFKGSQASAPIPQNYQLLWRLPNVRNIITLNIDPLLSRAHAAVHQGARTVNEFGASQVDAALRSMHGGFENLIHLHGYLRDQSSWVFTQKDLRAVQEKPAYGDYIKAILATCVNIFLGISVDDVAIGSHLKTLKSRGLAPERAYWLTTRQDSETDRWAEGLGIRIIRYTAEPDHAAQVGHFLRMLIAAQPEPEAAAPPVVPDPAQLGDESDLTARELPPAQEAEYLPVDELRYLLNREASRLLEAGTTEALSAYDEFCEQYDRAIYNAWYTHTTPGKNKFFDYTLQERVAGGAFGQVFRGTDKNGDSVAIKLLHHEIRSDAGLLRAFRRGVQSMRILSRHNLASMVRYRTALEIPSVVVMDWIDGVNLEQAKGYGTPSDWATLLRICIDLGGVIATAHQLPERVLHRDLRPANIMLRNYWDADHSDFDVVVLDFDLSWHSGAEQRSVVLSTAMGYLAPEQRHSNRSAETRSAKVDSYGMGMTLLYLLSGRNPTPDQHLHADFAAMVSRAAAAFAQSEWRSLPARFARLLVQMTSDKQEARPEMPLIVGQLRALRTALLSDDEEWATGTRASHAQDLVAEEVASRVPFFSHYMYAPETSCIHAASRRGVGAHLVPDHASQSFTLKVEWARTGTEDRGNLGKYVERAHENVVGTLKSRNWTIVESTLQPGQSIVIEARCPAFTMGELEQVAQTVDKALGYLDFG